MSNKLKILQKWLKGLDKDYTISKLKQLKELYLYSNNLTSIPKELGELKQLEYLYLNDNNLTSIPKELGELEQLEWLDLSNNGVILSQWIPKRTWRGTTIIPYNNLCKVLYSIDSMC